MNRTLTAVTLLMVLLHSCEEPLYVPCDKCYEQYPEQIYLEIELTNSPGNPDMLLITVYEGVIEDNLILRQFTTSSDTYRLEAILYKDYTVTAEYIVMGGNTRQLILQLLRYILRRQLVNSPVITSMTTYWI